MKLDLSDDGAGDPASPPERSPFLPSRAGVIVGMVLVVGLGAFILYALVGGPIHAPNIGRIAFARLETTGRTALRVPGGRTLKLVLVADSYSWSGYNRILLDARGLRDGRQVVRQRCIAKRVRGSGSATGVHTYNSSCNMYVPAPGITALEATLRRSKRRRRLDVSGLVLDIK